MLSGILQCLSNLGTLILGLGILLLVFDLFHGVSKELDYLQEIGNVPNERKFE